MIRARPYRVRKKVFARLPTVSWFGACEDFLPGAVQQLARHQRLPYRPPFATPIPSALSLTNRAPASRQKKKEENTKLTA